MESTTVAATERPASRVHTLLKRCLYETPPANEDEALRVEGVMLRLGFDPKAIEKHRAEISVFIDSLVPDEFYEGMSFLRLCVDRKGEQWGEHRDVDALLCLGIAIGRAQILFPRDLWAVLPGGMPYVMFLREKAGG